MIIFLFFFLNAFIILSTIKHMQHINKIGGGVKGKGRRRKEGKKRGASSKGRVAANNEEEAQR